VSFLDTILRAKAYLEQQGRVSLRALAREFALEDEALDELVEELVDVQSRWRRERARFSRGSAVPRRRRR